MEDCDKSNIYESVEVFIDDVGIDHEVKDIKFENNHANINSHKKSNIITASAVEESAGCSDKNVSLKTEVHIKLENIEDAPTCRVCLQGGSIPIYGNENYNNVSKDLNTLAGIHIKHDDKYPKHLCEGCNNLLQNAMQLRMTAQYSDIILREQTLRSHSSSPDSFDVPLSRIANAEISPAVSNWAATKGVIIKDLSFIKEQILSTKSVKPKTNKKKNYTDSKLREAKLKFVKLLKDKKVLKDKEPQDCKKRRGKKLKTDCKHCSIDFETKQQYEDHMRSEEHKSYKKPCPLCHKEYSQAYYRTHMSFHRTDMSHICDICGKEFKTKLLFEGHRKRHALELPFQCSFCPYRHRERFIVKKHERTHVSEQEKPFQCPECLRCFSRKSNMKAHRQTHQAAVDFKCDTCHKGFHRKTDLENHFKSEHLGIKDHICDVCGKAFGFRKLMMKHKLKVHKREKLPSGRTPLYRQPEYQKALEDKSK